MSGFRFPRAFSEILRTRPPLPRQTTPIAPLTFGDFSGGFVSSQDRDSVPDNASPNMLDMEVTYSNRLIPASGSSSVETFVGRAPQRMIVHANVDLTAELVLFDPPYVGVKRIGSTAWTNVGLRAFEFAYANYGGTLIVSDGHFVFKRDPGEVGLSVLEGVPVAGCYAVFAARLWAGNCVLDGNMQPQGIAWSSVNFDPTAEENNYSDLGVGSELLLSDMTTDDKVVALRPMGLDFMAILCRKSIWIARRTGLLDPPADLQPRVSGIGAVNEPTVCTSRYGIFFLTYSGVYVFDGNNATLVSEQINPEILPLDFANIAAYRGFYSPLTKQYWLLTPTATWVYEIEQQRWYKKSLLARDMQLFAEQFPKLTWGELTGTWGEQEGRWKDYSPEEGLATDTLILGNGSLEKLDPTSRKFFGEDMTPLWEFKFIQQPFFNRLITAKMASVEYDGEGEVEIWLPGIDGVMAPVGSSILPTSETETLLDVPLMATGRGAGMQLRVVGGTPRINKVQLQILPRGQRF